MKVGKKLLSTLLAILMIVSSVSVCFGVLGASETELIDNLVENIELHYGTLADYILEADAENATDEATKRVPKPNGAEGNVQNWQVVLDSATSSWHWVTAAYAEAANYYANGTRTIYQIYDTIKGKISERRNDNSGKVHLTVELIDEVLRKFTFGENENTTSSSAVSFYIGAGFDVLQWAPDYTKIPDNAAALQLYTSTTTFNVENGKVTSVVFKNDEADSGETAESMKTVRNQ